MQVKINFRKVVVPVFIGLLVIFPFLMDRHLIKETGVVGYFIFAICWSLLLWLVNLGREADRLSWKIARLAWAAFVPPTLITILFLASVKASGGANSSLFPFANRHWLIIATLYGLFVVRAGSWMKILACLLLSLASLAWIGLISAYREQSTACPSCSDFLSDQMAAFASLLFKLPGFYIYMGTGLLVLAVMRVGLMSRLYQRAIGCLLCIAAVAHLLSPIHFPATVAVGDIPAIEQIKWLEGNNLLLEVHGTKLLDHTTAWYLFGKPDAREFKSVNRRPALELGFGGPTVSADGRRMMVIFYSAISEYFVRYDRRFRIVDLQNNRQETVLMERNWDTGDPSGCQMVLNMGPGQSRIIDFGTIGPRGRLVDGTPFEPDISGCVCAMWQENGSLHLLERGSPFAESYHQIIDLTNGGNTLQPLPLVTPLYNAMVSPRHRYFLLESGLGEESSYFTWDGKTLNKLAQDKEKIFHHFTGWHEDDQPILLSQEQITRPFDKFRPGLGAELADGSREGIIREYGARWFVFLVHRNEQRVRAIYELDPNLQWVKLVVDGLRDAEFLPDSILYLQREEGAQRIVRYIPASGEQKILFFNKHGEPDPQAN